LAIKGGAEYHNDVEGKNVEFHNTKKVTVTLGAQKLSNWNLELPWPAKELSPNFRGHWSTVAKAKKAYRLKCSQIGLAHGLHLANKKPTSVKVHLIFCQPDHRARDWDNMLASMKSGLDGLADAMGVDDSKWRPTFDVADDPVKFGKVLVSFEVAS
jgi:crossover junction endodeoxyribonuclease RusA